MVRTTKTTKTIAIVINTSWNIYNFRLGLLDALRDKGYRVIAIAPRDDYSEKLKALGFEYHDININNKGTNPFQDFLLMFSFYRLYKKLKPDVILQYTIKPNIYGTWAAKMVGIPVVNNISGLGTVFLNDGFSSKLARWLYRFSLRFAHKVFFQNPHDRQLFVDNKLIKAEKTDVLPGSGIDVEKFKPVDFKKEDQFTFVFLLIARMIKDKGIVEFVEAARAVSMGSECFDFAQSKYSDLIDLEFWLLGDLYLGNPTAISQAQLEGWQREGVVKYLGHVDDVASIVNKADCVVLPSYREGLSRVLLEAAALAKPIITTSVPGCKDVVDDGDNGFLCKVKDAKDLEVQMQKMLNLTNQQRQIMGQNGRRKIEQKFNEKIVISKYLDAIQVVLN